MAIGWLWVQAPGKQKHPVRLKGFVESTIRALHIWYLLSFVIVSYRAFVMEAGQLSPYRVIKKILQNLWATQPLSSFSTNNLLKT